MNSIVERIIDAPQYHWVGNGFRVHGFLPQGLGSNDRMSPFFLLDYNPKIYFAPSAMPRGVGVHPHRGMETVTIAFHGKVAHHDSAGNHGIISSGDVQWMTAGRGILHKEYHEQGFVAQGGEFQMVQLWVNLPSQYKMTEPAYQELPNHVLGTYDIPNKGGSISVIAGKSHGVSGPAKTFSPILLLTANLESRTMETFSFSEGDNTGILVLEGSIEINGESVAEENTFVLLRKGVKQAQLVALQKSVILLMSGQPINEPVVPYGPFLMNSQKEIKQAFEDFQNGKFGNLED